MWPVEQNKEGSMDPKERNASTKRVDWFDDFEGENRYRFLSNFYVGEPIEFTGVKFATGEHMFAALKAQNRLDFDRIAVARNPASAKAIGRKIGLRSDWEAVKYDVMRVVLATKFAHGRIEALLLASTGGKMLVEGTDWNDRVWGVNRTNGLGRNWLGILLMARRAELVAEGSGCEPFDYTATTKFIMPTWVGREKVLGA